MDRGLLLYDADCGFCSRVAGWVPRLRLDVEVRSLQETGLAELGVDPDRARVEMPFVDDGVVSYGHRAWAAALVRGSLPVRLLGRALGSRWLSRPGGATYRWVARHRHRLPGGTPQCALDERG